MADKVEVPLVEPIPAAVRIHTQSHFLRLWVHGVTVPRSNMEGAMRCVDRANSGSPSGRLAQPSLTASLSLSH